jgi:hypothetical protein
MALHRFPAFRSMHEQELASRAKLADRSVDGDAIDELVSVATRAPSGDNLQPWRFVADPASLRIAVYLDEDGDRTPMNSGQRMARIACGAAIENLIAGAPAYGYRAALVPAASPELARVTLTPQRIDPVAANPIRERATNRKLYDGRLLAPAQLDALSAATPPLDNTSTHWIVDRPRILAFANLIARADRILFAQPRLRRAVLDNIRFGAPAGRVDRGLSEPSLELGQTKLIALRALKNVPDRILTPGAFGAMAAHTKALVASASGLCLVVTDDDTPMTDVAVGRAIERAWLELTREKLAAQPMMSLLVLAGVLDHGPRDLAQEVERAGTRELLLELAVLCPEIGAGRAGFLLRFGSASPPSDRSGRLPAFAVSARVAEPSERWSQPPSL